MRWLKFSSSCVKFVFITANTHNMFIIWRAFLLFGFSFFYLRKDYKIINWGKLINVDGTLVFFKRRHIIVPIDLKNISIVQLLSASLHRSQLNKGCTCTEYLEISNGFLYYENDFWTKNWQDYIWNGCIHLLYKWDKWRNGVNFETDILYTKDRKIFQCWLKVNIFYLNNNNSI